MPAPLEALTNIFPSLKVALNGLNCTGSYICTESEFSAQQVTAEVGKLPLEQVRAELIDTSKIQDQLLPTNATQEAYRRAHQLDLVAVPSGQKHAVTPRFLSDT